MSERAKRRAMREKVLHRQAEEGRAKKVRSDEELRSVEACDGPPRFLSSDRPPRFLLTSVFSCFSLRLFEIHSSPNRRGR